MGTISGALRTASFGPFEVDFRTGELRKQGHRIRLQDQPLQILATLVERPGEMVSREELRQRLWPGDTFVDFDHGLHNAMNRLRDALGDSAETPTYIETIPRRGYRFIAAVRTTSEESARSEPSTIAARSLTPGRRRVLGIVTAGLASVLIVVLVAIAFAPRRSQPQVQRVTLSASPQALEQYLRAKPYLGVAKPDDNAAAITLLEKAVVLDPSFATAHVALGNAYRIRGIAVEPHNHEWEEKAFAAVQRALQLDPRLAEAYVVRAKLVWSPRNNWAHERAVQEIHRALTLDPTVADGRSHLGDIYNHIGLLDRADKELQQAVALDPLNTAARFRLGVNLLYQGRWEESLAAMRDGRRFNPSQWTFQTAFALFQLGRHREARERVSEFLRNDAHTDPGGQMAGMQALFAAAAGDARAAEEAVREAVAKGRGYVHFHHTQHIVAATYARLGNTPLVLKYLQQAADNGFPCYPLFERDANFDGIRGDPRFADFMKGQKAQWERRKGTL